MKTVRLVSVIASVLLAVLPALSCSSEPARLELKQRYLVAVFALENKSSEPRINKFLPRIQEVMISELLKTQRMRLVERDRINTVMKEQALGETGLVRPGDAEKVGRLIGADAVLIGSLASVQFHKQESGISAAGALVGMVQNALTGPGDDKKNTPVSAGSDTSTVTLKITARIVHATTGEILSAGEGEVKVYLGSTDNLIIIQRSDKVDVDSALSKGLEDAVKKMVPMLAGSFPGKD